MTARHICLIGSAGNVHVRRWAMALDQRGLRVSLISTTAPDAALRHLPVYVIPTTTAGMSAPERLVTFLRGWARVPGLIAGLAPELTHIHALPNPSAAAFLRLVPRLVVSAWGSDVVQRDGRKERFYPGLLAHAAAITATSDYLATVVRSYLESASPIHIVPFGVDLERFTPAPVPPRALRIGAIRHLEPQYGLDVLIDALPAVLKAVTLDACVIAGGGSVHKQLRQRAAMREASGVIQWLGRISHDDVPAIVHSLALFVNPSRAESFGVAALEAQACGVPVVASNVGGLPEVVRHGETGLLVPPEDPAALARALVELLSDAQRRRDMGLAARTWVSERYDWRDSVSQMLDVYAQAVGVEPE